MEECPLVVFHVDVLGGDVAYYEIVGHWLVADDDVGAEH